MFKQLPQLIQFISLMYTELNDKRDTFVFAPIVHELNSRLFLCTQKTYFSQILFTNLSKSVLVNEIIIHLTDVAYQDDD